VPLESRALTLIGSARDGRAGARPPSTLPQPTVNQCADDRRCALVFVNPEQEVNRPRQGGERDENSHGKCEQGHRRASVSGLATLRRGARLRSDESPYRRGEANVVPHTDPSPSRATQNPWPARPSLEDARRRIAGGMLAGMLRILAFQKLQCYQWIRSDEGNRGKPPG
jgi:hypothetical protein